MNSQRIVAGIQPSGQLHIGNYFGSIKNLISKQSISGNEIFCFIADFHAMTSISDKNKLRNNTLNLAKDILALGLDPEKSLLFKQSSIREIPELSWILSTVTNVGLLQRSHAYKDKIKNDINPSVSLLNYPLLMSADILIFENEKILVGSDQKQHIEICQSIAISFNAKYGKVFKLPEIELTENPYVIGLDGRKMSKSYNNYISIFEDEKTLSKKIASIITDCKSYESKKDAENCTVFKLYSLFASPDEIETMRKSYENGNYGYGNSKKELQEKILEYFCEARKKRESLTDEYVNDVLENSANEARLIASNKMNEVRKTVGLV